MNGYVRRTKQKKAAILEAAQALFFQQGVAEVRVSDIAKAANVSQVTIYNYFHSKENLLREVMRAYMTKAFDEAEALCALDIPFTEKMNAMMVEKAKSWRVFSKRFIDTLPWGDPALQELYREFSQTKGLPLLLKLVKQGKSEGSVDKAISNEAVIAYISTFMPILTDPDFLKTRNEYKEGLQQLFFYGLIGR